MCLKCWWWFCFIFVNWGFGPCPPVGTVVAHYTAVNKADPYSIYSLVSKIITLRLRNCLTLRNQPYLPLYFCDSFLNKVRKFLVFTFCIFKLGISIIKCCTHEIYLKLSERINVNSPMFAMIIDEIFWFPRTKMVRLPQCRNRSCNMWLTFENNSCVDILVVSVIGFRITVETNIWSWLWGIIWFRLNEVGSTYTKVSCTFPWAKFSDEWKGENELNTSLSLLPWVRVVHIPSAMPSQAQNKLFFFKMFLLGLCL